jgi:uncharacterized Zn-finger protein
MSEILKKSTSSQLNTPNDKNEYQITQSDLPLHCPMPEMSKWNSHPKVFIPVEDTGEARCPYCGALYRLIDSDQ